MAVKMTIYTIFMFFTKSLEKQETSLYNQCPFDERLSLAHFVE